MHEAMLFAVATVAGVVLLSWSADRFVAGASGMARSFGIAPMIIGLTIVAFGTSTPEILVSATAAWHGNLGLALGNAVGSNIANMALVLGVAALITPLTVHSRTLSREFPLMMLVMFAALMLLWDSEISRRDGLLLLFGMVVLVLWTVKEARSAAPDDVLAAEFSAGLPATKPARRYVFAMLSGLLLLLISSRILVWGAEGIARSFGMSDLVIGLTVVAVGTSLPELAATVVAVRKGEHDMAVGGIVGSNLFNILAVLGIAGVVGPGEFDSAVLVRDYPLMIVLAAALYFMARGQRGRGNGSIRRWAGAALFSVFICYQLLIFFSSVS